MTQTLPQIIIDVAKDLPGFRLPRPPQVVGKFAKPANALGQVKVIG